MNIRNLKVLIVAILLVIAVSCKQEAPKEDPAPKDPAAATTDTEKAAPVAVPDAPAEPESK